MINKNKLQVSLLFYYECLQFSIIINVAQWLEKQCKDLMILASLVRIPLWDVGASP
jgi:hypothetical protein